MLGIHSMMNGVGSFWVGEVFPTGEGGEKRVSWGSLGLTSVVGWVFLGLLVQELFFWGACVFVMGVWTCEGESGDWGGGVPCSSVAAFGRRRVEVVTELISEMMGGGFHQCLRG